MFKTLQKVNLHSRSQTCVEGNEWKLPSPPDSSHPHYYQKRGNESRHLAVELGRDQRSPVTKQGCEKELGNNCHDCFLF